MDDDYEGGRWIGDEFYYKRKKERPQQTKDDALYGVFADSSDDSDSGRRKRRRSDGSKADLTRPVQFISTGTVMPNKEIEENVKDEGVGEQKSGLGLGFGLGFRADDTKDKEEQEDVVQDVEESFLPSAFGRKIKEGAEQRKKEKEKEKEREKERTGSKKTSSKRDVTGTGDIGNFESHTKGIGMKLMKMMGYKEGTGLGKNKQGIVAPVEAKLRPKKMGMGFNDYKEAKLPVLDEPVTVAKAGTSTGTVPVLGRSRERLWSKQKQGKKRSEILTKDELLAKKQEQGVEMVQKIIDMRGPQVRVLTSLENLNSEMEINDNDSTIPMPELQYNIRLIVETTEADLQKKDRDLRREREKVASLLKEKEKIETIETTQRVQLQAMETIMSTVDQVKEDNELGLITLDSLLTTFSDLKLRFKEEYKMCNLSIIVCAFAHPLLLKIFQKWDPLHDPLHGLQLIQSFKDLLQGDQPFDYSDSLSPYTQLINEIILPAIRINSTNSWLARDPEPMLTFLETWDRLLPPVILNSILDNIIMPKLTEAVGTWDPRVETVPIHVWIHPWLPLLGTKLEILHNSIQYKLGCVLQAWHASDRSAFAILSPWKDVFAPASWDRLMLTYIVPKLRLAMQDFKINPANQNLEEFRWVMTWTGSIPVHHMVHLLETEFFSKWNQVLYHWLCSSPDFNEVMNWYVGWKNLFPEELLANERIRVLFTTGLDMMNQAVEGMQVVPPGTRENVSYLRASEKRQMEKIIQQQSVAGELSFKEIVQKYASEHGVLFMPRVGKFYNAYQVYDFGNVGVYVDSVKKMIYAQVESGVWSAVSMAQLMEMNRNAKSRR
ncbi:hypothetical protein LUZ60_008261 [Juncus effusus]|nr:hypothetical protein LUZ60_008261 [Juncus effusus]